MPWPAHPIRGSAADFVVLDELLGPPAAGQGDEGDDLDHLYCECSPDLALCGADLSDNEDTVAVDDLELERVCVVCIDLSLQPTCERCGGEL